MIEKTVQNKKAQQIIFYNGWDFFCALLLFVACICYRPMILGNDLTLVGAILFAVVIFLMILRQGGKLYLKREAHTRTYLCAMLLFAYCAFQCVILKSDRMVEGVRTCIFLMLAVTAFAVCFSNKSVETIFVKTVFFVMAAFACSYIISAILMLFVGWNRLLIGNLDYGYYMDSGVYFPFTITYGNMRFNDMMFRRLLGFARESGIMQIFYVWGFFSAERYFERPKIMQIIMITGVVACLSTSGYIVFGVSLLLYFDVRNLLKKGGIAKLLVIGILIGAMIYILFYAEGTRIADRAYKTIEDRMDGIKFGLSAFKQHPIFGAGFYSTLGNSGIQAGICAIGSLGQVGIVGMCLWLLVFWFSYIDSPGRKRFLFTNAAMFITGVFAQPIMFAPVMYWFLFADYDEQIVTLKRIRAKV